MWQGTKVETIKSWLKNKNKNPTEGKEETRKDFQNGGVKIT